MIDTHVKQQRDAEQVAAQDLREAVMLAPARAVGELIALGLYEGVEDESGAIDLAMDLLAADVLAA
jgi:hypothetical protein